MNIFSQQNFDAVQEVVKSVNGKNAVSSLPESATIKDEIAELNQQSQRIQQLIAEMEALPDPGTRAIMQEFVQEILSFYGHGLERILEIISKGNNTATRDIYNSLIEDSFVTGLLLIHDLHPLDLKTRLYQALEKVKPYIQSHGGTVELISLDEGIAKLKLAGSCKGCPSSSSTLELGIKQAIEEVCPDLLGLEVEGITDEGSGHQTSVGWKVIRGVDGLPEGGMKAVDMPELSLIVCRVNGQLYAYRNHCPACDRSFSNGQLEKNVLGCQLGHRYDVQLAGRCTDDPGLHLDPFPLLEENGVVKISA